jgi:paired small multidrug resistance pump
MAWIVLMLAGVCETVGVIGMNMMNRKRDAGSVAVFLIGFTLSFVLLSIAMRSLPMGTAYAVWTGIGTVGSVLAGIVFYGESRDWRRMLFMAMVICAVVGLKLVE